MNPILLVGLAILAPVASGVATMLLPRRAIGLRVWLAAMGTTVSFAAILLSTRWFGIADVQDPLALPQVLAWLPSLQLNVAFLTDGLGVFFALLISGIGTLIVLYTRAYFGPDPDTLYRFYPTLGFFTTSMLGIVLADYLLLTLLFWELTSISSFLLIGWNYHDRKSVRLATQAFITTGLGGLALFGGILLFGNATAAMGLGPQINGTPVGLWRWSELLGGISFDEAASHGQVTASLLLMLLGAATKSAQFPWHYWLPGAMAAPTPVSAFLHSATMVKAGVFLTARMFPIFQSTSVWPWWVIGFGAITMLLGAMIALNKHDLKQIFAYTTVSHLGLLMCVYGLGHFVYNGHPNIDWDISQIANHAFYKAPLFLIAGGIAHVSGTRLLPDLFGFVRQHRTMTVVMLLAGYALAGGPGTVSFAAKELFLYAVFHAAQLHPVLWIVAVMAILTAACNVAIFIRLFTTLLGLRFGLKGTTSQNSTRTYNANDHERGWWWPSMLWLPGLALLVPQYVGGLVPGVWEDFFTHVESNKQNYFLHFPMVWKLHLEIPLLLSVLAIGGGVWLGLSRHFRGVVMDVCDQIYPTLQDLIIVGGARTFVVFQTGHLRSYMFSIVTAFMIAFFGCVFIEPDMIDVLIAAFTAPPTFWPGTLIGLIICGTALALPLTDDRALRILLLGACGFSVVGMYLIYQAPDLALTQLMFEIISVILFLLVLRLLPTVDTKPRPNRWSRTLVSASMGIAVGWMTLVAASAPTNPTLGTFFARHTYEGSVLTNDRGAGGHNMVNTILVDFRGFDTLGEITVLALAALGVWSMIPALKQNVYRPKRSQKEPTA